MSDYTNINKCRICGNQELIQILHLGSLALTGVFPKSPMQKVLNGPVTLVKCEEITGCGLVQLREGFNPDLMYGSNYGYRSGLNESMVAHLKRKVSKILDQVELVEDDIIIDIGSNDGTTLRAYPENRYDLVGIDPSGHKFQSFYPPEIRLFCEYFSSSTVGKVLSGKKAKVITSFSMFYDLDDPLGFARVIETALHDDGIWVLEQSYLPMMLERNSFDTICHEHLEYYSLKQIDWICREAGLKILNVEFNDVNGGSFSVTVSKKGSSHVADRDQIDKILSHEQSIGLSDLATFTRFALRIEKIKHDLLSLIRELREKGNKVYALGASTKGNVLLQYLGIDSKMISAIGEVNEDKFGAFTPGSLIPIVPENDVLTNTNDYILVLPWHFKDFFVSKPQLRKYNLIFPLPEVHVVRQQQ